MAREHNDANVIAFGARVIGEEVAKEVVEAFLTGKFESQTESHVRRVKLINSLL